MTQFEALAGLVPALHELNKGKGKNFDQYPALKTKKRKPETWWDSLEWNEKVNVGGAAMHFGKMSANYKWKCQTTEKYTDLTPSQQRIVNFLFKQRSKKYSMFDIASLFGL